MLLHTETLPPHLRPYLELYLEAAYSLPVTRAGDTIPYEQVSHFLSRRAVSLV